MPTLGWPQPQRRQPGPELATTTTSLHSPPPPPAPPPAPQSVEDPQGGAARGGGCAAGPAAQLQLQPLAPPALVVRVVICSNLSDSVAEPAARDASRHPPADSDHFRSNGWHWRSACAYRSGKGSHFGHTLRTHYLLSPNSLILKLVKIQKFLVIR